MCSAHRSSFTSPGMTRSPVNSLKGTELRWLESWHSPQLGTESGTGRKLDGRKAPCEERWRCRSNRRSHSVRGYRSRWLGKRKRKTDRGRADPGENQPCRDRRSPWAEVGDPLDGGWFERNRHPSGCET